MGNPGWLEPEEGFFPGWEIGKVLLDKRSGLLVEIVDWKAETLDEGYDHDGSPTDRTYFSFQIVFFDDGTDPTDGVWRAPEDLELMNAMEILAHAAR
jgi:hypothetical protein